MSSVEGFPYIEFAGQKRYLACIPSQPEQKNKFTAWSSENAVIPESDIAKFLKTRDGIYDMGVVGSPILDQGNCGGCGGWSATSAFNLSWNLMSQVPQRFSPAFQYAQVNQGYDQGSTPTDNMTSLMKTGVCLESDNPKHAIFATQIPPSAKINAARFRVRKSYLLKGWDDLISAVVLNRVVSFGTQLPNGFQNVDQESGFPPQGGNGGLHAMMIRGLVWHPRVEKIVCIVQNSWTERFGIQESIFGLGDMKGCCLMMKEHIFRQYFEGFAVVADVPDPKDNQVPDAVT
jgi:hypothetical protein